MTTHICKRYQKKTYQKTYFIHRYFCTSPPVAMDSNLEAELKSLLEKAANESLLSSMEQVYNRLRKAGLLWSIQLSPSMVGVHELNRDGLGCDGHHVHELVDRFWESGFVPSAGKFVCVELAPGDQVCKKFNEEMVDRSNNQFLGCTWILCAWMTCTHILVEGFLV